MDRHLRAGIALYNAGQYGDARAVWERADPTEEVDERLLAGLGQLAQAAEWAEETALARAREHLTAVPEGHRGVDVAGALQTAEAGAPKAVTDGRLRHRGATPEPDVLSFEDAVAAARAIAAEHPGRFDPGVIRNAIEYARGAIVADDTNRFVTFLFDFVAEPDSRATVYRRLADHVARRRRRTEDVEGLF